MKAKWKNLIQNLIVIVIAQAIIKTYGYLRNVVFGREQILDALFFIAVYMIAYVLFSYIRGE